MLNLKIDAICEKCTLNVKIIGSLNAKTKNKSDDK